MHTVSFQPDPGDTRGLRNALGRFATGVTVVTTRTASGKLEGLTANSFSAVSLDPPLVLWSLRKSAPSLASFEGAGVFAINVLAKSQRPVSQHFATPQEDKFAGVEHVPGISGCPLLVGAIASFECTTEHAVTGGDHVIFIGRVVRVHHRDDEPLIFSGGRYATHAWLDD